MIKKLPEGKISNELLNELLTDLNKDKDKGPKIGEDAAEINLENHKEILISSDPITFETENIGSYLIDVCTNDIYASSGIPKWLVITVLIPLNTCFENLKRVINNLNDQAKKIDLEIIGGHTEVTSSVNKIILSGTVIGTYSKNFLKNQKIKPGQDIILGGYAGIEGSKIIASNIKSNSKFLERLQTNSNNLSISVKNIAKLALESKGVIKMHDPTEGGIATAIHELAEFGKVGCEINFEKIRFVSNFIEVCKELNINPLGVISSGCLLIISNPKKSKIILNNLTKHNLPANIIGKTTKSEKGNIISVKDHFSTLERFDQDEIIKIFK